MRYNWMGTPDKIAFYNLDGSDAFNYSGIASANPMINGYAVVTVDWYSEDHGTTGLALIDQKGNIVYVFPEIFNKDAGHYANDWDQRHVCSANAGLYSEGLVGCIEYEETEYRRRGEIKKHYFIDNNGVVKIDLTDRDYDNSSSFHNGYALVHNSKGYYGFIDKNGNEVIPLEYENATQCYGDLFAVKKNGKWGYINSKNEVVIPFEYDAAYGGEGGFVTVGKDGKYGIVNYKNEIVVPLEYDDISGFENGVAYAIKDERVYIITID